MTHHLLPRLSYEHAKVRLDLLQQHIGRGTSPETLVDVNAREAVPNPTGGRPVSRDQLKSWRDAVVSQVHADRCDRNVHGIRLGRAINEVIAPIPSDAAHDGVWSFLSLYVFPDLVFERWPGDGGVDARALTLPADRWIGAQAGRDRNYAKLCWRRWKILGPVMENAFPALGEDEFGALLERTAVARNSGLVRACAERIVLHTGSDPGRMVFARELMKRVCYQTGSRSLEVLDEHQLKRLVDQLASDVLADGAERSIP